MKFYGIPFLSDNLESAFSGDAVATRTRTATQQPAGSTSSSKTASPQQPTPPTNSDTTSYQNQPTTSATTTQQDESHDREVQEEKVINNWEIEFCPSDSHIELWCFST